MVNTLALKLFFVAGCLIGFIPTLQTHESYLKGNGLANLQEYEGRDMTNELFLKTMTNRGSKYWEAREDFLEKSEREDFLEKVLSSTSSKNDEAKYVAGILLARLRHKDVLTELEKEFHAKSANGSYSQSASAEYFFERVIVDKKYTDFPQALNLILQPGESYKEMIDRFPSLTDVEEGKVDPQTVEKLNDYWSDCLLNSSPHWNVLLREIVLKGWVGEENGSVVREVPDEILLRNAVDLLGQLKDSSARIYIERILLDQEQPENVRASCAIALGEISESVEVLLSVAIDKQDEWTHVSVEAVVSIAMIGGPEARNALVQIGSLGENELGPKWASVQRSARSKLKQMDKLGVDKLDWRYFD